MMSSFAYKEIPCMECGCVLSNWCTTSDVEGVNNVVFNCENCGAHNSYNANRDVIEQFCEHSADRAIEKAKERKAAVARRERVLLHLRYWKDVNECQCSAPHPIGGCLHCDMTQVLEWIEDNKFGLEETE